MPRDLSKDERSADPVTLTESPNSVMTERSPSPTSSEQSSPSTERQRQFVIVPEAQQVEATNLHPYTRPLTVSDLDACVALENAAFTNPNDRATPEKVCLHRNSIFQSSTCHASPSVDLHNSQ